MTFEWSDIRCFLAVARTGSTSSAARQLGMNQTTCARRIAMFEASLEMKLFERGAGGYKLTPAGETLQLYAESVERAVLAFEGATAGARAAERKLIRFTTSDWTAEYVVREAIAEFASRRPDVSISVEITDAHVDLTGGSADVALRGAFGLEEPTLIARKVADTPWSFYCGPRFAEACPVPRSMPEALKRRLAILSGPAEQVMKSMNPGIDVGYSASAIMPLAEAIARGVYVGALPNVVGDSRKDLQRCCPVDYPTPGLWLVFPERLRDVDHVREFVAYLAQSISTIR